MHCTPSVSHRSKSKQTRTSFRFLLLHARANWFLLLCMKHITRKHNRVMSDNFNRIDKRHKCGRSTGWQRTGQSVIRYTVLVFCSPSTAPNACWTHFWCWAASVLMMARSQRMMACGQRIRICRPRCASLVHVTLDRSRRPASTDVGRQLFLCAPHRLRECERPSYQW